MRKIDLTGNKMGKWDVIDEGSPTKRGTIRWNVRCQCGYETALELGDLKRAAKTNGGCWQCAVKEKTRYGVHQHKLGKVNPAYGSWRAARERCTSPNNKSYHNYGGRGITMCEEWLNNFQAFFDYMGPRPPGGTLERLDNNGNYEPGNVKWATRREQRQNQRTKIGKRVNLFIGVKILRGLKRGQSKGKLERELGLTRNTVHDFLNLKCYEALLQTCKKLCEKCGIVKVYDSSD